ncbi:MAG: outer membrane lipoprotein carrier protein [Enterobacterales bacterium]|jgi:outer membrane lipoprotein carrier protein
MKLFKIFCLVILLNQTYLLAGNVEQNKDPVLEKDDVVLSDSMDKLNGYLVNIDSYEANFQQSLSGISRGNSETTSGRFLMKRPDRFRWQINFPYQQTIIADGKSIWTIDNDLEQVTVNDIDESIANSPIMLISRKNNELEKLFIIVEIEAQEELEKFLLKPKDSSSNFEFIQLGFKDGVLQFIELNDNLGQVTSIVMTNIRNNPIIANQEFIYEEMTDFDLIDSRERVDSREQDDASEMSNSGD